MVNLLTRKLELFGPLPNQDRQLLDKVIASPKSVRSRHDIISEGESPSDVHLVLEGLACRYKVLPDGTRQIFAYLIPGDFCDLNVFILKEMDHSIGALAPCAIVDIPRGRVLELTERPAIARAFWWATLVDEATLREWLVNLGRRDAEERIAHLFCELYFRMRAVGLTTDGGFALPITQNDLGDTMGLSTVHSNRSLQTLRSKGLIEFASGEVAIPSIARLMKACGFDPKYLHLEGGKIGLRSD